MFQKTEGKRRKDLDDQRIPSPPTEGPILTSLKDEEGEGNAGAKHEGFKPNPSHNRGKLGHQNQLATPHIQSHGLPKSSDNTVAYPLYVYQNLMKPNSGRSSTAIGPKDPDRGGPTFPKKKC